MSESLRHFDDALLKQEVEELTELLRHEEVLGDLRALLRKRGQEPAELLLAGLIENAEGSEGDVIVTPNGEVFEFERNVRQAEGFSHWGKITDISELVAKYPAILVALQMIH